MVRTMRVMPPASGGNNPFVAHGRSYSWTEGRFLDVIHPDALVMMASGWSLVAESVGTSLQRPIASDPQYGKVIPGWRHIDLSLGRMVIWAKDGSWIDPITGDAV